MIVRFFETRIGWTCRQDEVDHIILKKRPLLGVSANSHFNPLPSQLTVVSAPRTELLPLYQFNCRTGITAVSAHSCLSPSYGTPAFVVPASAVVPASLLSQPIAVSVHRTELLPSYQPSAVVPASFFLGRSAPVGRPTGHFPHNTSQVPCSGTHLPGLGLSRPQPWASIIQYISPFLRKLTQRSVDILNVMPSCGPLSCIC